MCLIINLFLLIALYYFFLTFQVNNIYFILYSVFKFFQM